MGGEFVVNKDATKKHLGLLYAINSDKHAEGGHIRKNYAMGDGVDAPWEPVADSLALGTGMAFAAGTAQGGPWYGIGYAAATLIKTVLGSFGAKAIVAGIKNNMANGGQVQKNYASGGVLCEEIAPGVLMCRRDDGDDWWNPSGIFDPITDIVDDITNRTDLINDWISENLPGGEFIGDLGDWTIEELNRLNDVISGDTTLWEAISDGWEGAKDHIEDIYNYFQDCFDEMIDWDAFWALIHDLIRLPLKQVSKDLATPEMYYTDVTGTLDDIFSKAPDLIWEYLKGQFSDPLDWLDCLHTGTDYVPRTGTYLLEEGEAVVPKGQNAGGGSQIIFINKGIITTSDVDGWFADRMESVRVGRRGYSYQTVESDTVGLRI